jgi:hypothetical protein
MTRGNPRLDAALRLAAHGWPVFPLQPGIKVPLERSHGLLEATTSELQVIRWWDRHGDRNIGLATGAPGPDVLDVDTHGSRGNGYGAWNRLRRAGLVTGPQAVVRTPSGGMHAYFAGTDQPSGKLSRHGIDWRARGGYVVAPGSHVDGRPYVVVSKQASAATADFGAIRRELEPEPERPAWHPPDGRPADARYLAAWVAQLPEGNRNDGTFWALNRAIEHGDSAAVAAIRDAALSAGLTEREVSASVRSALRTANRPPEREAG